MSRRIVVLGANGKVGSEVTVLLKTAGCDVIPVCRGEKGSAYLRRRGIAVRHGSIGDPVQAPGLIGDADVLINFALPLGVPSHSRSQNTSIIDNCFTAAPRGAMMIFCSTLVAHKGYHAEGQASTMSQYGREKRANTARILALARKHRHPALVVRLGHVAGESQPITRVMRQVMAAGPVAITYPDRAANLVHVATIADMLRQAAEEGWRDSGVRDLVDQPRLDWVAAFQREAALSGIRFYQSPTKGVHAAEPAKLSLARTALNMVKRSPRLRGMTERVLAVMPESLNRDARIRYLISQNAADIAALPQPELSSMEAMTFPEITPDLPPGLRDTNEILADPRYAAPPSSFGPAWPDDLPPAR